MSEKKFIDEIKKSLLQYAAAKNLGHVYLQKIHGSPYMAGMPDLLCIINHRAIFIEAKIIDKEPTQPFNLITKLTPLQRATLNSIALAGGNAYVAIRVGKNIGYIVSVNKIIRNDQRKMPASIQTRLSQKPPIGVQRMIRNQGGIWSSVKAFIEWMP